MTQEDDRFERALDAARAMTRGEGAADATRARILKSHAEGQART